MSTQISKMRVAGLACLLGWVMATMASANTSETIPMREIAGRVCPVEWADVEALDSGEAGYMPPYHVQALLDPDQNLAMARVQAIMVHSSSMIGELLSFGAVIETEDTWRQAQAENDLRAHFDRSGARQDLLDCLQDVPEAEIDLIVAAEMALGASEMVARENARRILNLPACVGILQTVP